jgi:hypothetical protein
MEARFIEGYPDYLITNTGLIFSLKNGSTRLLKSHTTKGGYKRIGLCRGGKQKLFFVHDLVAKAFISNPHNKPYVNHKDEDKTNNFVENLEWCTAAYNCAYGKGIEKHAKKIRGKKLSEEHKLKISEGVKRSYGERKSEI